MMARDCGGAERPAIRFQLASRPPGVGVLPLDPGGGGAEKGDGGCPLPEPQHWEEKLLHVALGWGDRRFQRPLSGWERQNSSAAACCGFWSPSGPPGSRRAHSWRAWGDSGTSPSFLACLLLFS